MVFPPTPGSLKRRRSSGSSSKSILSWMASNLADLARKGSPIRKATKIARRDRTFGLRAKSMTMRKKRKLASYAPLDAKLGGKLRKGLPRRIYKKKSVIRNAIGGVNRTVESSKVVQASDCVWIGHHSMPRLQVLREAFIALMYSIFQKIDVKCDSQQEDQTIRGLQVNDIITFHTQIPGGNTVAEGYQVPVGGTNLQVLWNWFSANIRGWNNNINSRELQFKEIIFSLSGSIRTVNANNFKISLFTKSSMKIQNRSQADGTTIDDRDNSESVDNVPIIGKSYSGNGSGLILRLPQGPNGQNYDMWSDQNYGTIIGTDAPNNLKEPPQPTDFRNVKFCGKAKLNPGIIKTSNLYGKFNGFFNTLFQICQPFATIQANEPGLVGQRVRNIGGYRVFALEKVIDVGSTQPITVAFENNLEISAKAYYQKERAGVIKSYLKQVLV